MHHIFLILILLIEFLNAKGEPLYIVQNFSKSSKNSISLCVKTNRYFQDIQSDKLKYYIKITPLSDYKIKTFYDELCISNLEPNREYEVYIDKNIPLNGIGLNKNYSFRRKTGNYKPYLDFKESGYILPSKGDISIPLESLNIKRVKVSLYRINRNNLVNILNSTNLKEQLSEWDLKDIEESSGYHLWDKRLNINSKLNKKVITAIPVGTLLKSYKPGVYIIAVAPILKDGTIDTYSLKSSWFMVSDIGIYTLQGAKKLHIYTKHLSSAKPYDVKIEIISKNNEILESKVTKDGYCEVDSTLLRGKGGLKPKAIYAYGKNGDFSVLNLTAPVIDLTDRGDGGLDAIKGYSAYIFSNRGIFKPNSKIPIHILIRDSKNQTASKFKFSAKLYNPKGNEIKSKLLSTNSYGYTNIIFKLPNKSGRYRVELFASSKEPIGRYSFSVEDFIPPKIEANILSKPKLIKPDLSYKILMQVNFLTKEPLSNPKVSYTTILHTPKVPFKEYKDYHFGKIDEDSISEYLNEQEVIGDENGSVSLVIDKYSKRDDISKPIFIYTKVKIKDPGGRAITKGVDLLFEDKKGYIGIKAKFDNSAIDLNQKASFDLIYLSNLKPKATTLEYKLIREEATWNWESSQRYGWRYYRVYEDMELIKKGSVEVKSSVTNFNLDKLDWGYYRLELKDEYGDITSYRFSSGYDESASKVSPDKLPILLNKKVYKPGEVIKAQIVPKFDGPITINIASNEILETRQIDAKAGRKVEVTFNAKKDWQGSLYLLATAFRAQSKKLGANRAIGLAHISIKDPKSNIILKLNHPKRVKSKDKLTINIDAKYQDKNIDLIVFAVDEGVLNLTNYKAPNPMQYFFGKHKLGITIRDIYSELIKTYGEHAQFNVGAGDEAINLNNKPTPNQREVVALSSKIIRVKNHSAKIEFDIPSYQGRLKLIAVAWGKNSLGNASSSVVVKDPLSIESYMPRFLSKGDNAKIVLQIKFDNKIPKGNYTFKIKSNSIVECNSKKLSFNYESNNIFTKELSIRAIKDGLAKIEITALKDGKTVNSRVFKLLVRDPYARNYIREVGVIDQQTTLDSKSAIDANGWSSIKYIKIKLQSAPLIALESLKKELISYCCRCAEQTTSRGFAFIDEKDYKDIVTSSIERLYNLQKYDGGFGLWESSDASLWITSYVLDFLSSAKEAGFEVDDNRIKSGLDYLERNLNRWSNSSQTAEANTYAIYVLTKNGKPLISEINYHINNPNSPIKSASAWGYLALSLNMIGEEQKAKEIFRVAKKHLNSGYYNNYGGTLRDKAILITQLIAAKFKAMALPLYIDLAQDTKSRVYLSTQELSSLIRASKSIDIPTSNLNILINNKPYNKSSYFAKFDNVKSMPYIKNLANTPLWYSIFYSGIPNFGSSNPIKNRGFTITKELYDTKGNRVDISNIRHTQEIVVVISGTIEDNSIKNPLILDLLPASFELDNPTISGYDTISALNWLKDLSTTTNVEYRDDRYIATLLPNSKGNFKVAYLARAVSKGEFKISPALISDMYRPYFRAYSSYIDKIKVVDKKESLTNQNSNIPNTNSNNKSLTSKDYEDAFNKPIGQLSRYTTLELNRLRNGIFAQIGLNFENSNITLHKEFLKYKWYKPTIQSGALAYSLLSPMQKENISKLLNEEKRRLGGLSLSDFYRVATKELDRNYLKRYNKKELRVLRNSLIARYGYKFKDKELFKIFSNLPWYNPKDSVDTSNIIDNLMSEVERKNLFNILSIEKELK